MAVLYRSICWIFQGLSGKNRHDFIKKIQFLPLSHRVGSEGMLKSEKDGAIMLESAAMPGKA